LQTESYPALENIDAIVHSVGSITDLINYKQLMKDPYMFFTNQVQQGYESSLEA